MDLKKFEEVQFMDTRETNFRKAAEMWLEKLGIKSRLGKQRIPTDLQPVFVDAFISVCKRNLPAGSDKTIEFREGSPAMNEVLSETGQATVFWFDERGPEMEVRSSDGLYRVRNRQ